jgi:hypothetical protein
MATITPVAYKTGGGSIAGTTKYGNLYVGTTAQDYGVVGANNGVVFYSSPNQELGYVIAHEDSSGIHNGLPGNIPAYVGFWRSAALTEVSFVNLVNGLFNQTFTGGTQAKEYLNTNNYWTSYSDFIVSAGKTDTGGYTVGTPITKDMQIGNWNYTNLGTPNNTSFSLNSSYWADWNGDIFDSWGYFYLYDPSVNNYLGLQFTTVNQPDGVFNTQVFNFNGRAFSITQGYPVQGIFKFEIRVNDDLPFIFGEAGNMGSDGQTANFNRSYNYTLQGVNLTLWYNENNQVGNPPEKFFSYYVPFNVDENGSKTYVDYLQPSDNLYLYSIQCTNGLTVYHSKGNDVKEWVVYDLTFGE